MNYLLVDSALLAERGLYPFADKLGDGRSIVPITAMRVLTGVDVYIASKDEIDKLKKESEVTDEWVE